MKLPVYLSTLDRLAWPSHLRDLRFAMFLACRARWRNEPTADLQIIMPEALGCSVSRFQRERRVWADRKVQKAHGGRFYVLADDDCLPASSVPFLEGAVEVLRRYKEFAILSLLPTNAQIGPWRPGIVRLGDPADDARAAVAVYEPYEDEEVMEHVSVGGIRVCRAGCLKDWPEQTEPGYDRVQADALRRAGYRVGYFRKIRQNHLGEGYSTVWPK